VLGTQIYRWFAFRSNGRNCRTCAPGTTGCTSVRASKTYRDSDYLTAAVGAPVVFYASILNLW